MAALIFGGLFLLIAIILLGASFVAKFEDRYGNAAHTPNWLMRGGGVLLLIFAAALMFFSSYYSQGVGEASVIKSFTGQIIGYNSNPGPAFKAPWDDRVTYDILNQQAIFSNPNNVHDDQKKNVKGGEITVTDKDGVAANVDVAVRYSIRGDKVVDTYSRYGDQNAFESKLITQDVRSVVREAPNSFATIDVLTKRADVEKDIYNELKNRWEKEGVQVESVALQDIRYPQSVTDKFAAAQNARTQAAQAQAELDAAKISSQQQVVQAQAQADANKIIDSSLTDKILQQRSIDAFKELAGKQGTVVITDGKSIPMLNVGK